jgi:FixJ family two-component response regulator
MRIANASDLEPRLSVLSQATPTVFAVDDDLSVRESLELLLKSAGWQPVICASAAEFLSRPGVLTPSCLILDVALPGLSGFDLLSLVADRPHLPVIFISGCGDIPMTVRAMKAGAVEFLTKPFEGEVLLAAVRQALDRSRAVLSREAEVQILRERYVSLSPRERQVMALVAVGRLNKQVGVELGISEITVKAHRGTMMRKMKAQSLVDLLHMASTLHVTAHGALFPEDRRLTRTV